MKGAQEYFFAPGRRVP